MVSLGEPSLLKRLLQRLADGDAYGSAGMALDLGVSLATLGQMIGDLVRLGYLRSVEVACPDRCGGCPLAGACAVGRAARLWTVTERGRQAIQREVQ